MANSDYKGNTPTSSFTPMATLAMPLDYLDRTVYLGRANFPRIDSLKVGMAALVGNEFLKVTALGPGSVAVARGTADTVPAKHVENSYIWFIDNSVVGTDGKEHSAGETTSVKYSPTTAGGGRYPIESSNIDTVTYNWRFYRPYPPGQMRANGDRWFIKQTLTADTSTLTLTWAHRDRLLEADQLVDHDVESIGPEPGTSYTVRIYNAADELLRTEPGIMSDVKDRWGVPIAPAWTYTWAQAMQDFGFPGGEQIGASLNGKLTLFSTRDGFDSWQGYEIEFELNTQGRFLRVAQAAEITAQRTSDADDNDGFPPLHGLTIGQAAEITAQRTTAEDDGSSIGADGLFVGQAHEGVGQQTAFYTPMNRNLFEAPYAFLQKTGRSLGQHLVTVVARPADRLTDAHDVWTREANAIFQFNNVMAPRFTPWMTLGGTVDYLATEFPIENTSFADGISLSDVKVGQVALIDAEVVRVDAKANGFFTLARGCYDTIPARHLGNSRMWFFETDCGNDPSLYPLSVQRLDVKVAPAVYGPPLPLSEIPTDNLFLLRRFERPYPPGQVLVNGQPWFKGAIMRDNSGPAVITWVHRNRDTQGAQVIDHTAPNRTPEDGTKYELAMTVWIYPSGGAQPYTINIRTIVVDGLSFTYTVEMAKEDGYRAGQALQVCGSVTLGLTLTTIRGESRAWQSYVIPVSMPSYTCPPGQTGGGGQLPGSGGGNGSVGGGGDDNTGGGGPKDPVIPGGDDGSGPPDPGGTPPDWPDPVDPPEPVDPGEPNPALKSHWDLNWDRHWDAYNKDNTGS